MDEVTPSDFFNCFLQKKSQLGHTVTMLADYAECKTQ